MNDKQIKWVTIATFCLCILWVPAISLTKITTPEKVSATYPGLIRISPGQSYITDPKSAAINPLTQRVLIAETLNRKLANTAFNNPIIAQKMKLLPPENLWEIVRSEDTHEVKELSRTAKSKDIVWDRTAGDWGMFLLKNDPKPSSLPIFGKVEFPGGKEKSTFLVERNLNLLLNWVRETRKPENKIKKESVISMLKESLNQKDCPIQQPEAVELYALSKILNINYDPESNLFLSQDTKFKNLAWIKRNLK